MTRVEIENELLKNASQIEKFKNILVTLLSTTTKNFWIGSRDFAACIKDPLQNCNVAAVGSLHAATKG